MKERKSASQKIAVVTNMKVGLAIAAALAALFHVVSCKQAPDAGANAVKMGDPASFGDTVGAVKAKGWKQLTSDNGRYAYSADQKLPVGSAWFKVHEGKSHVIGGDKQNYHDNDLMLLYLNSTDSNKLSFINGRQFTEVCATVAHCAGQVIAATVDGYAVARGFAGDSFGRCGQWLGNLQSYLNANSQAVAVSVVSGALVSVIMVFPNYYITQRLTAQYRGVGSCTYAQTPGGVIDAAIRIANRQCARLAQAGKDGVDGNTRTRRIITESNADEFGTLYGNRVAMKTRFTKNSDDDGPDCEAMGYRF